MVCRAMEAPSGTVIGVVGRAPSAPARTLIMGCRSKPTFTTSPGWKLVPVMVTTEPGVAVVGVTVICAAVPAAMAGTETGINAGTRAIAALTSRIGHGVAPGARFMMCLHIPV